MFDFMNFMRRKWAEYSAATGQKGTTIDDLAVKPTALVMSDFYNSLVKERRINNVLQWQSMTEDELDAFGNKFFIPRMRGDVAFSYVRVWVDNKQDVNINDSFRAIAGNGKQYRASAPMMISRNMFRNSRDSYALYYVDIPIVAVSAGNDYNIDAGQITSITGTPLVYKYVTNPEAIRTGTKTETNEEYFWRLQYAINDRSMMSKRSMYAVLGAMFPSIRGMYIAGAGDRYMQRDLVSAIDISEVTQKVDFLGKIASDTMVKHRAFYGFFPPDANSQQAAFWGPFSIPSAYDIPISIEPLDDVNADPAYHGFPLDQELSSDQYRGMYFNDYRNSMVVKTEDLFNIADEDVGFTPVLTPNQDWVYGAHGYSNGDVGPLADEVRSLDVLSFSNNTITVAGGATNSISTGKAIGKRIGVKVTGTLAWPSVSESASGSLNSNIQVVVGGVEGDYVEGYTGVGFGVRVKKAYTPFDPGNIENNAIMFFSHSEKYGSGQVFAHDSDTHINFGAINSIAETACRIEPTAEYEFEFVIYDDLRLSLLLRKVSGEMPEDPEAQTTEKEMRFSIPSNVLSVFASELKNRGSSHYGTVLKVTLDTKSTDKEDKWTIEDLRAFDVAGHRAMSLMLMDVAGLEAPISISCRAHGSSAVNGVQSDGHQVYIWDNEQQSQGSTAGGWSLLDDISSANGSKSNISGLLKQDINGIERYIYTSRFGDSIALLFVSTGVSMAQIRYSNQTLDDIQASVEVDYIKIEGKNISSYHANNKADVYVTTVKNSEALVTDSVTVSKADDDSFFVLNESTGFKLPIAEIVSVVEAGNIDAGVLPPEQYNVLPESEVLVSSARESWRLYLSQSDLNSVTVTYRSYPDVSALQDYYDTNHGKIFGNILVKHRYPCDLSFTMYYTGDTTQADMLDIIKRYFDDNQDGTFSIQNMVDYLYKNNYATNVQSPITVSYSKLNDEGETEIGTFTDRLTIRDIDYFRLKDISANKV